MRRRRGVRVAIVLLGCVVLVACGGGSEGTATPRGKALAHAKQIEASVDVSLASAKFASVSKPVPVEVGDVVRTDESGFAEVAYFDGSLTRLDVSTEFTVVELSDGSDGSTVRTKMGVGRTWNRVEKLADGDEFVVETSVATATVRGTAFFVDCPRVDLCTFTVLEGTVELTLPDGDMVRLTAPSSVTVTEADGAGDVRSVDPAVIFQADGWLEGNAALDAKVGFDGPEKLAAVGNLDPKTCARLVPMDATNIPYFNDGPEQPVDPDFDVGPLSPELLALLPAAVRTELQGIGAEMDAALDAYYAAAAAADLYEMPRVIDDLQSAFAALIARFNAVLARVCPGATPVTVPAP